MDIDDLIKSCDIGLSTVLIEKEALGSNKFPDLKTKEDFVLWLKLLSKNIRIYGLDKELAIWRKNNNSLSSSLFQKIFDGYKVYNVYMKYNMIKSIYYLLCLSINFLKK
jgi:teichuronic acid biosynthesis glycosyltransferase TuaG